MARILAGEIAGARPRGCRVFQDFLPGMPVHISISTAPARALRGEAATVIGVSQDDAKGTKEFNQEYGVTFPTLVDSAGYPHPMLTG